MKKHNRRTRPTQFLLVVFQPQDRVHPVGPPEDDRALPPNRYDLSENYHFLPIIRSTTYPSIHPIDYIHWDHPKTTELYHQIGTISLWSRLPVIRSTTYPSFRPAVHSSIQPSVQPYIIPSANLPTHHRLYKRIYTRIAWVTKTWQSVHCHARCFESWQSVFVSHSAELNDIKYSAYRTAMKLRCLQKSTCCE